MKPQTLSKRQGISFKKQEAFHLIANLEILNQKDQNITQKISCKQSTAMKDVCQNSKTLRNERSKSNPKLDKKFPQHKTQNPKTKSKFSNIHLNSPITQYEQNIDQLVEQITPKAKGFYRFSMKSYEKPSHKRVFSDMMNLPPQTTKGMMYVGELWTNDMSNKFLRLNKIQFNKIKFFQQLNDLKWQNARKLSQKQLDTTELIDSFKDLSHKSLKTYTTSHLPSLLSLNHLTKEQDHQNLPDQQNTQRKLITQKQKNNSKEYREMIAAIRSTINQESTRCKSHNYRDDMKQLEAQSRQIHRLWEKYFQGIMHIE